MSHPIENIMHSSMEHVKALADVNTVIGDPIVTEEDVMILPVSKVCLGMIVGGGEYITVPSGKKNSVEITDNADYPFIGASTVGMCLTPLAFLAVEKDSVRVLPARQERTTDRLIDLMPRVIDCAERLMNNLAEGSDGCKEHHCRGAKTQSDTDKVDHAVARADEAAQKANDLADKAKGAAAKAKSAAEIAYDAALEASRTAAQNKEEADKKTERRS